jgi:hypothetical protein
LVVPVLPRTMALFLPFIMQGLAYPCERILERGG